MTVLQEGLSYAEIARELYVTRSTVAFHLSRACAKTGTTSRMEYALGLRRRSGTYSPRLSKPLCCWSQRDLCGDCRGQSEAPCTTSTPVLRVCADA